MRVVECSPTARSNRLGTASVEAWPAAGGGFLVGIAEPAFAGGVPLRFPVKTAFVRIATTGRADLVLPYVMLEAEASRCAHAVTAMELALPGEDVTVAMGREQWKPSIVDLSPPAELALQLCAASARTLMLAAAAESWVVPADQCCAVNGIIIGPRPYLVAPCREFVADATLVDLPQVLQLRSGRLVRIRPIPRCCRYHRPNVVAIKVRHSSSETSRLKALLETEGADR